MGSLDGKIALVTGAGQSIGRGIALALATEGAAVTIAELDAGNAKKVAAEVEERGASALAYPCDIRDNAQVAACVAATVKRFGGLNILVNNAMASVVGIPLEETTDAAFALSFATGPAATFAFMRAAFPHLQGDGRIVNLRSGSELSGLPGYSAYVAAKAAVGGLTKVAAREWGAHGITVNAVAPFAPGPTTQAKFEEHPEMLDGILRSLSIKRTGDAEQDIGRAVAFLVSPAASYITGCTLMVDGGGSFL
ncbi:SDR family NAD(P)-dependent oxidoreductase [Pseudofrankia inefficax]|uniref:Short-chain dehydrogenase/reductase SDR n=1 Tax=Pseudofrankia inefficax (strain DSM 45817 / CECT 9037 / DDB 130130 / EuI1c) TaxID=298654 RepID=E3IVC1_PSEI1|nr:SDR family oxidoreductase [Pseudofrankia inefficax]ADP81285.1 short-chain dehydrogenase/reductase SDR [Pseudofrankia inefficax]